MPRNYNTIEKEIFKSGFFSEYLPPCFKLSERTLLYPPTEECDLIAPLCFTMSRYNGNDARRNIFIPEIGSYLVTEQYLKHGHILKELIEFSETEDASFSPTLGKDDTIVRHEQSYGEPSTDSVEISSDYIDNVARKIIRSAGARQVLKLDISNCFSSFYMHMIPAILLGMEDAESEYNKYCKDHNDPSINPQYLKYRRLDAIIRRQNLGRTNGLLTGTLYSKIIAEAILTRIDKELQAQGIKYSRFVDDYEVYLYNNEEKQTISIFEKTLKRYGFTLNSEKTELLDFPYYVSENLGKIFSDQIKDNLDNSAIMELFNSFLTLEKSGTKGAIRYLLKSIEKEPIETTNPELYKSYLLTILENNERSLTKACLLLINNKDSLILKSSDITFVIKLLTSHLNSGHDLEVVWLLYLLILTGNIVKGDPVVTLITNSHNELAQLLLLHRNLLSTVSLSHIRAEASSWILLYELYAFNYIEESDFVERLNINKNLSMYQHLKRMNLHFCDFQI